MAFINPGAMDMSGGGGNPYSAGPSQGFLSRMLQGMQGGGGPQPVGGPTQMQRVGGAINSGLGAMNGGGPTTMPMGRMAGPPPMSMGAMPGGSAAIPNAPMNPLWMHYLQMLHGGPQMMGGPSPMGGAPPPQPPPLPPPQSMGGGTMGINPGNPMGGMPPVGPAAGGMRMLGNMRPAY